MVLVKGGVHSAFIRVSVLLLSHPLAFMPNAASSWPYTRNYESSPTSNRVLEVSPLTLNEAMHLTRCKDFISDQEARCQYSVSVFLLYKLKLTVWGDCWGPEDAMELQDVCTCSLADRHLPALPSLILNGGNPGTVRCPLVIQLDVF